VTSTPAGINCGATCSASFDAGTVVTLNAVAAAGSTFAGWSGGGCSGTGPCSVTLNAGVAVTANFITAASCPCSIWNDSATPAVASQSDTNSVEIGVRFRSDLDGTITALRFYKGPANSGTHVGKLWTN